MATLAVIVFSVLLPMALMAAAVSQEALALYEKVRSGQYHLGEQFQRVVDALPAWLRGLLDRFGIGDLALMQEKLVAALGRSGQVITAHVFTIGQNTLDFVLSLFVMLYLLFFLLRDGPSLVKQVAQAVPLKQAHTQRLMGQFTTVVRATVKGNVLVALVQGALGALAFWFLDIPGALLWGALMAVLSLLPAVGAVLVWLPVVLYYLATGAFAPAVGLTCWGVLVIGLVDNILRPILVGKETRMPDYLVLIATLGGLAVFGLNGFVIGPVIAALFLTAWEIFGSGRRPGVQETM